MQAKAVRFACMKQGKRITWGLVLAVIGLLGPLAGASAVTIQSGNLVITSEGGVAPTELPREAPAPISFWIGASVRTNDGSPLPAMKTFVFDADRQGELHTAGLAICRPRQLQSTTTRQARHACGNALVGAGSTSAVLAFPESSPTLVTAPLLMFNGGTHGAKTTLLMQVYAPTPAPTTFVFKGVGTKTAGLY